jgi:putative transposase
MQLVERTVINTSDSRYAAIDHAAFLSKKLYNAANYVVRQSFLHGGAYLPYPVMYDRMKAHEAYKALPAKVSKQVLRVLDKNWKSYFAACKEYARDPLKFLGHPKLPGYKDKQKGRNLLVYTVQAISKTALKRGYIAFSGLLVEVPTQHANVDCVRIIPRHGHYVVEVVYEQAVQPAAVDPSLYAGIDIGLNNLATLTSNKVGFVPRIVNGRPVKSVNQYYVRRVTHLSIAPAGSQNWKEYSGVI